MAYLGNRKGPRESEIVQRLGNEYFGITPAQLASDIDMFEDSERRNEVQPVCLDEQGRPYVVFPGQAFVEKGSAYVNMDGPWRATSQPKSSGCHDHSGETVQ